MSSRPRNPSAIVEPRWGLLGPDRSLALVHAPFPVRNALASLWVVDATMGRVVATTSEPAIGAIRLAWWREALTGLELDSKRPSEPTLRSVQEWVLPFGVGGRDLAELEDGWAAMLEPFPWSSGVVASIAERGRHLFKLGAKLLGGEADAPGAAGAIWALADAARHCSDEASRDQLREHSRFVAHDLPRQVSKPVRPLTMLAALAMRDLRRGEPFEPEGTPGRAAVLIAHRLTGRLR